MALIVELVLAVVGAAMIAYSQVVRARRFPRTQIALWGGRKSPTRPSPAEGVLLVLGVAVLFAGAGAAQVDHGWAAIVAAAIIMVVSVIVPLTLHNRGTASAPNL